MERFRGLLCSLEYRQYLHRERREERGKREETTHAKMLSMFHVSTVLSHTSFGNGKSRFPCGLGGRGGGGAFERRRMRPSCTDEASRRRSSIGYLTVLGLMAVAAGPEGEAPRVEERVGAESAANGGRKSQLT